MKAFIGASFASLLTVTLAVDMRDVLRVDTTGGTVLGFINGTTPHVRQFLSVPYAQPPVGELRWMPPQPLNDSNRLIDATRFGPSCPQQPASGSSIASADAPLELLQGGFDEDCLTLAIWAPVESHGKLLPVYLWIYGGGYETGGINTPSQEAAHWVERTRSHVVVAMNYRTNIFGFPGAPGLEEQNLGLLDSREAVVWARDNIAGFGGDPDRMVLWGQSSGAGSVDMLNFAFPDDPIVSGFIADSGSVFLYNQKDDPLYSNFTVVADYFNCSSSSSEEELACMRRIPYQDIEDFLGNYTGGTLNFVPFVDDKVIFANWSDRYALGALSDRPAIFGSNLLEGNQIVSYPDPPDSAPDFNESRYFTLHAFQCPAALTSQYREALNLTTFRYQYRGNFSDISPRWWEGAYHGSELPLIFGTYVDFSGPTTPMEVQTSQTLQDLWLAFGYDPAQGVKQHGWQPYGEGKIEVFAGYDSQGQVQTMQAVASQSVDGVCVGAIDADILSGENPFSSFS
ncbi:hypothetical protein ASPZODRAFT_1230815 [Penicilliopsis zonata CBS 506.65]|uniref:Carboxylic ester hydrolase n=1 Tax=Penicilliopsis zonata CBS 506.65 TaxID=1073090 RepID=A0A1L9S7M9_9EURO|nr:hypothetical protein ASPZODRAFT_1230815 [Penicilliopsis zonata CBS 506.65]OJJ43170.1 hypothetical protein ASPZODRAFT_1230815 [Penicilliopsis zonata CBS 506.65]